MYYSDWVTAVCNLLEYTVIDATSATPTDVDAFNVMIPSAIAYTENRMQRDIDFLQTSVTTATGVMVPNSRTLTYPSTDLPAVGNIPDLVGTPIPANSIITTTNSSDIVNVNWPANGLIVGENVSLLNPLLIGGLTLGGVYTVITIVDPNNFTLNVTFLATSNDTQTVIGNGVYVVASQIRPIVAGKRLQPLNPVTRSYLDYVWPDENSVGAGIIPLDWCPKDQTSALVGPAPDVAYGFEVVGTMRIPALSATNFTNFLTQQFFDVYVICSMIYWSAYQQNFGASSEDAATAQSYENQYQLLLKSAITEEARKNYMDMSPSPSKPTGLTAQTGG